MTDPADILKAAWLPVPEAVAEYQEHGAYRRDKDYFPHEYEVEGDIADAALVALAEQAAELEAMLELAWVERMEPHHASAAHVWLADLRKRVREGRHE
jgi:hypothetical protein